MARTTMSSRLFFVAALALVWGCDDAAGTRAQPAVDAGEPDWEAPGAGGSDTDADADDACTPVSDHDQIVNAPTEAEKIDKQPVVPLRNADGTLPDLP